ncbi:MAG TPA: PSD1 and planctomycete cytochrome C domain-containing protein [Pirellulales bacterium]|nr:PSD1 and planctomycete cytochrome C domain-containing protein [Pirellulales bacterium]
MMVLRFRLWLAAALLLGMATSASAAPPALDFNRDIRPILSENCFYCHGQDANKRKADLRLDVREIALSSGAIVPEDAAASQLVARINSADPDEMMPPSDSNRRLSAEQKTILERWIAEGAAYATHWAFVAPRRPAEPEVKGAEWVRTPIDRFVLAKLEAEGLAPSPEADRATLIKRLAIDLTGLPPTLEEVDEFVADADPQAYENLVERLLASPHYGERMALDWLDAARYADSNGFQQDGDTWQWIWRDWVVRALNADLPFDEFTVWQLAGDLLPDATNPQQTVDQKIASAFNRNHLLNGEGGAIAEEQRYVNLFDRIDTTATTWLGLTMACAQCHDHKYDPITQRDYYGLLDAFNRVPESGTPQFFSSRIRVANPVLELPTEENRAKFAEFESQIAAASAEAKIAADAAYQGWREGLFADGKPAEGKGLPDALAAVLRKAEAERSDEEKRSLEPGLRKHFDEKVRPGLAGKIPSLAQVDALKKQLNDYRADRLPRVMVMSDERPRETTILNRGDYLSPGEKISFATPAFLPPLPADAPRNRLGFARWLVSPEHPLTARVQVNRMWQYFFGAGIVKTAEDFGVQSEYPIHGELLDWLATEFVARGWSRKAMHRLIVTSAAYRQSSRMTPEQLARDQENRLYSRAGRFRMPSMVLRDWALAAAGLLDGRIGGAPVYPYQPDAIWEALAITKERDFTYPASSGADLYRPSLYTFWRRTVGPANMFDASNRQTCRVRHAVTSTPLHSLTMLNDPTWVEAARVLAEASMKVTGDLDGRLAYVFRRVVVRAPADRDLAALRRAYETQAAIYRNDAESAKALLSVGAAKRDESLDVSEHAALSAVCLAILNLDEALTRE